MQNKKTSIAEETAKLTLNLAPAPISELTPEEMEMVVGGDMPNADGGGGGGRF